MPCVSCISLACAAIIILLLSVVVTLFIFKPKPQIWALVLISTADIITDAYYLFFTSFYWPILSWICLSILLLQAVPVIVMEVLTRLWHRDATDANNADACSPNHDAIDATNNIIYAKSTAKTITCRCFLPVCTLWDRCFQCANRYPGWVDNIVSKLGGKDSNLILGVAWFVLMYLVFAAFVICIVCLAFIWSLPVLCLGYFLVTTKLYAVKARGTTASVQTFWLRLWAPQWEEEITDGLLQKLILIEVLGEALPSIIIQTLNNYLCNSWPPPAIVSLLVSGYTAMNTLYRVLARKASNGQRLAQMELADGVIESLFAWIHSKLPLHVQRSFSTPEVESTVYLQTSTAAAYYQNITSESIDDKPVPPASFETSSITLQLARTQR